jgi:hypothetical protein
MGFGKPSNYDVSNGKSAQPRIRVLFIHLRCADFAAFDRLKLQEIGGLEPLMSRSTGRMWNFPIEPGKRGWVIHYEPKSVAYDATRQFVGF